jgi:PAS domain S-box-containing protein
MSGSSIETESLNQQLQESLQRIRLLEQELHETNSGLLALTMELEEKNEQARESEERYRRIVETSIEGIWVIDRDCKTTFVNQKMAEMFACTVEDLIGRSMYDFIDDDLVLDFETCMKRHQQGIAEQYEFKFRRQDGKAFWVFLSASPLLDLNGQYSGALMMVTDTTERKQFEQEMARLDRLHLVGECLSYPIWSNS